MQAMGPEQLFRLVLNSGQSNLDVADVAEQGAAFEKRMSNLVKTNPQLTEAALVGTLVVATAAATVCAYTAMANRLDKIQDERESYEDMIEKGVSTYFIAQDRQKNRSWDIYVAAFVNMLKEQDPKFANLLWRYAGIHQKTINHEKRQGVAYGVMSVFSTPLGRYFPQTADDADKLTQARKSLNIFIQSELKEKLRKVEAHLEKNWLTDLTLFADAERFLPWLNATRFLLISLGSIGSNLLFSMNPDTGMPLSYHDSAELCSRMLSMLGEMRSNIKKNAFLEHRKSLCCFESFYEFLDGFASKLLALKAAYEDSAEIKLNLNEISNNMHLILQQLYGNFRDLIYFGSTVSDADHLCGKIIDLADLISFHPEIVPSLIKVIPKSKESKKINYVALGINDVPTTVIDVLALWGDLSKETRKAVLLKLPQDTDWQKQFISILLNINENFIRPIEKKYRIPRLGGLYHDLKTPKGPAQLFLISSIALLMDIYRIKLMERKVEGQVGVNYQILEINKRALKPDAIYGWREMIHLLNLHESTSQALTKVMEQFLSVLGILKAVNLMTLMSQNNQRQSTKEVFQTELLSRLLALQQQKKLLLNAIKELINTAEKEKKSDKDLLNIITSFMNPNLKTALSIEKLAEEFDRAIDHSLNMLKESTYDERLEIEEWDRIDELNRLVNEDDAEAVKKFAAFYDGITQGLRSREVLNQTITGNKLSSTPTEEPMKPANMTDPSSLPATKPTEEPTKSSNMVDPLLQSATKEEKTGLARPSNAIMANASYAFQWQVISTWLSRASLVLLLLGLFVALLMVFGAQTIPFITALSAPVATGFVIGGLVSAAAGGVGLAAAYYTPKLFKHTPPQAKPEPLSSPLEMGV